MAGEELDRLESSLRELLVNTRKAKGLSQGELGRALGWTQVLISNYERGERRIGVSDFVLIARALGEEPTALLGRLLSALSP
jgi:transcriptional regulator with XRE-family HTH domain